MAQAGQRAFAGLADALHVFCSRVATYVLFIAGGHLGACEGKKQRAKSEPNRGGWKTIKLPASERPECSAAETAKRIKTFVHRLRTLLCMTGFHTLLWRTTVLIACEDVLREGRELGTRNRSPIGCVTVT